MARATHPDKDIESALRHAEALGWRVEVRKGHAWGRLYCPYNDPTCRCGEHCVMSVWCTPRNPVNHARSLLRAVDKCMRLLREPGEED